MTDQNKDTIRRWIAAMNSRDFAALSSLIADSYVYHGFGMELHGADGIEQFICSFLMGFPDFQCTIEELFAEGDRCACRFRIRGTHTGNFMGVPASGKQVELVNNVISRCENGRVVEDWEEGNMLGLLQQIGAAPGVEQNKAILRRWVGAFGQGREAALAILDEVVSPDYVMHDPSGEVSGREAMREFVGSLFDGMPNIRMTLDEAIAEGDRVAYRFTMTGTHQGHLMGFPPTGKHVRTHVHSVARIANGRVAEEWQAWDFQGFLQQLSSTEVNKALAGQ